MHRQLLAAAVVLCASQSLFAQAVNATGPGTLTIAIGRIQENRRDDADSPIAYAGSGPGGRIAYSWSRPGHRAYIELDGEAATLAPVATISQPDLPPLQESFDSFSLRWGIEWQQPRFPGRWGELALGLEFGAALTLDRHLYPGQGTSEQSFDLGVASVAPTARWTRRIARGEITAKLGVPLLALVDHPYADVRYATQVMSFRLASVERLRQADGSVAYEFAFSRRFALRAEYRLTAFALDDSEPIRRVAQTLSLGISRRLGASR